MDGSIKHSGTRHEQHVGAIHDTDPIDKRDRIDDYREEPQQDVARALSLLGVRGGTVGKLGTERAGMFVKVSSCTHPGRNVN